MLQSIKDTIGYKIAATDGQIGHVEDWYFDDHFWALRYVVVSTGHWLPGRQVILSTEVIRGLDAGEELLSVDLTREQIEAGPPLEEHRPVSRQLQIQLADYFGWTPYWQSAADAPIAWFPEVSAGEKGAEALEMDVDPHLRSLKEVLHYHIHASDGEIGHAEDFLTLTDVWALRYLVIDTRNWLPGKKVLAATAWIRDVNWSDREIIIDLQRRAIKDAPKFDYDKPVEGRYESELVNYYGKPVERK